MRYDNGGDLLVAVLRKLGIDTVFGIVSVHNLPLVEAVDRELRFVPVRHEASAVNAADAYGRARGALGCALTSTGTGAGNAAGSLIESLSAGSSVLHVTGQVESEFLGSGRGFIHETKDQLGMLAAVSAYAASVPDAEQAGRILREAARTALAAPGGPASVDWPIDLQYAAQTDEPAELPASAVPTPTEGELASAGTLLASARRPLVWAGGGVRDGAYGARRPPRGDRGGADHVQFRPWRGTRGPRAGHRQLRHHRGRARPARRRGPAGHGRHALPLQRDRRLHTAAPGGAPPDRHRRRRARPRVPGPPRPAR